MILDIGFNQFAKAMASADVYNDELIVSNLSYKKVGKPQTLTVRLDAITFFLSISGEMSLTVDYKKYCIQKNMLLQLNNLHILDNGVVRDDFEGYMIAITPKLALSIIGGDMQTIKKLSFWLNRSQPLIKLTEEEAQYLASIIAKIIKITKDGDHAFQRHILNNEISNLLLEAANINLKRGEDQTYESSYKEEVVQKFIRLVLENCKERRDLIFYSTKLCMSSCNLSRILKAVSGKTATTWINDSLLIEAKICLRNPEFNMQQISEELHFGDQSSFNKFFKKHTGITPTEYRKNKVLDMKIG